MTKRVNDFLSGLPMTITGGIFLAISLILMLSNIKLPIDPAWATVIISGIPMLYLALTRLFFQRRISSALLISIAMIASITIGELFAAGEVAFIMAIGAILEDMTVARAKKGLSKLISLAPRQGRKIVNVDGKTEEEMIPIEKISVRDTLRVRPGEVVPVDGEIIHGNTSVDQSIMTGESIPVDKTIGESVFCGTMNCFGSIDIIATKIGKDSSLQKLIDMVKEAENKKAPMQRIVDKWAAWLVPIALLIAIAAYFITGNIVRAVTVLVVFCPCALALATPTSIMAAIGQATKHGVLIKSGEALEKMGKVDCIAFDKTGTLTYGNLEVSDIITFADAFSKEKLLEMTAIAELRSEHPLGKAVVRHAKDKALNITEPEEFQMIPGQGIITKVSGVILLCGNTKLLQMANVEISPKVEASLDTLRRQGKASIIVASEGQCIGILALSDILREDSKAMIERLHGMETEVVLLTGDNKQTASYFADKVGIKNIRAELLPENKVSNIIELQEKGKFVCMIGDGVNDAPALKTANVSVAMGSIGSDIAIEAADIALMGDEISKIPYLKKLSNSTVKTIKGNITASMTINFVAIILSVMGILNPITGALVHNAGSVLIVLNAALLYDRNFN